MGSLAYGAINIHNARVFAPQWSQDLAFFTQLVWSASQGGPWSSPLLHEPEGFFQMVHTHLVLLLVVPVYALIPRQEVLLTFQGLFVGLSLWPLFRLAEGVGRERGLPRPAGPAALACLGVLLFGPLQALGTADFRPNALFLPGLVGVYAAAREERIGATLLWSLVAQAGRQEASYLLVAAGISLLLVPWGGRRRWRVGLFVIGFAVLAFVAWTLLKPQMFFHFDPRRALEPSAPLEPETLQARLAFAGRMARSAIPLSLLQPATVVGALPLAVQLARDSREWTFEEGPSVHWHVSWLCFAVPGMVAGAMAWPRRLGGALAGIALMVALNLASFPPRAPRAGHPELAALVAQVPPGLAVGADHDTIAAVAERRVLWNVDSLHLGEELRPYHHAGPWPLTVEMLDLLILDEDHRVRAEARDWQEWGRVRVEGRDKLLLARPGLSRTSSDPARP